MNDVRGPSETLQSLKRPLDVVAENSPQPIQPKDSAAIEVNGVNANGVNGTNRVHHEASDYGEPASKRVKLDNGKPEAQSHRVDARDKVKGVALVKEE